jgi:hypothetical protein
MEQQYALKVSVVISESVVIESTQLHVPLSISVQEHKGAFYQFVIRRQSPGPEYTPVYSSDFIFA